MKRLQDDGALKAYLRRGPTPETFTRLANDLRTQFGLDLTPAQASHLWRQARTARPGRAPAFERDEALMAFITDRADLMTVDRLLAKVRQTFGEARSPSRSQLFRLVQRVRETAAAAFDGPRLP